MATITNGAHARAKMCGSGAGGDIRGEGGRDARHPLTPYIEMESHTSCFSDGFHATKNDTDVVYARRFKCDLRIECLKGSYQQKVSGRVFFNNYFSSRMFLTVL